jgi:dihydroneopterin aldolase
MSRRSRLVEHVTARILESLAREVNRFSKLAVRVTKHNPPVNGQAGRASFYLEATPGELPLTE